MLIGRAILTQPRSLHSADATPAALTAHTRLRSQFGAVIDSYLNGITNYSWVPAVQPDVLLGGGAENFLPGAGSLGGRDYYAAFARNGSYNVALNRTALLAARNDSRTLGVFTVGNLPTWLDRNVYPQNLRTLNNGSTSPTGARGVPATDVPGLRDMTLKAIDILHARSAGAGNASAGAQAGKGWFLMSEAASIDKQMHALDYERALGDLLELDDTIRATVSKLRALGVLNETLILVTADHGHG